MITPYNAGFKGQEFDQKNIQPYSGYDFDEWCEFTGLFVKEFPKGFISKQEIGLAGQYPTFLLATGENHPRIKLEMEFDLFREHIYTPKFVLTRSHEGRGIAAFLEHLDLAGNAGFRFLYCWAFGGQSEITTEEYKRLAKLGIAKRKYHGYITWAKFGFTMIEEDHDLFITKIREDGWKKENSLHELLSTSQGYQYWHENGDQWMGIFDLEQNSINRKSLSDYLSSKNYK